MQIACIQCTNIIIADLCQIDPEGFSEVLLIGVGVRFKIAFNAGFTLIPCLPPSRAERGRY